MSGDALPQIPCKPEVERELLGTLLVAPERIGEVADRLDAADFHVSTYRKIYRAILQLEGEQKPVEIITVYESLAHDKEIADAGGVAFISKLTDGVYARAALGEYCKLLKAATSARAVQALCANALSAVNEGTAISEIIDAAGAKWESIRDEADSLARGPVHVSQAIQSLSKLFERAADGNGQMIGIPTGYSDLDALTAGWQPGDFNILAARPSVGKSALAIELSLRQAREGNAVLLFSLEMSTESVLVRMACLEARIDSMKVRKGMLSRDDVKGLLGAVSRINRLPLFIEDSAAVRVTDLRWRLRSFAKRHKVKFCVVDYLQLLRSSGKDRFEQVTNNSIELKAAAKELGQISGGSILALSQLNRLGATERPRLEHLRESGQIEQDADVVFLLSNGEQAENGQVCPSTKLLEVAKQRNGPWGEIRFTYLPAIGAFEQSAPVAWCDYTEPRERED